MQRRVRSLLVVLVLCALLVAGCGRAQRAIEQTVRDAVSGAVEQAASEIGDAAAPSGKGEATPPPATVEDDPADDEALDADVAAFDLLDSYRMTQLIQWRTEDGERTDEGWMRWEVAYVREPRALHWRMSGQEGPDAPETDAMEMIWVDGDTYMNYGGEWMAMSSGDDMQEPWVFPLEDFIPRESQRVGTETVNGYRTIHYRARDTDSLPGIGGHMQEADYWVSTEHDVVVRSIVKWEGRGFDGTSGEWTIQWDITDINESITISPPEGVAKPGLPEDVPLMPGATNVSSMMGMTSFDIDASADDVIAFYLEALEDNGWTEGDAYIETMRNFEKDGRSLTLMVDDEGTPTSVVLMRGD